MGSTHLLAPSHGAPAADRLEQAASRTAFVSRLGRTLSATMHTDRAVDLMVDLLTREVVDWAQVGILNGHSMTFCGGARGDRPLRAEMPAVLLDPGSSLGQVLGTGVSDLIPVPDELEAARAALPSAVPSPALRDSLSPLRPMDVLSIALSSHGEPFGVVTLARRGGEGFDGSAVEFLDDVVHRFAGILQTARALASSRRVATALARDLNPPVLPTFDGVRFATYYQVAVEHEALGGDFYDVHGDPDDWTAVMGDVCGKGVEAAVLTGRVRQTVRTAALVDRDPARMLELTNRVLTRDGSDTMVTAVCARGRRSGHHLLIDVASAGHPPPLVIHADGSVTEPELEGTVLGLVDDATYTCVTVDLAPGETCLFYTDGVSEAPGHQARFGEERLRGALEATGSCDVRAQVDSVAVQVSAHLRGRAHDDIAILALQAVDPA